MTNEQLPVTPANERDFSVRQGQISFSKPEQGFALVTFLLGFLFWRWLMIVIGFSFQGGGVTLFAALYVAAVSIYFRRVGVKQNSEAKLWLGVVLATALSFAVWSAPSISPWRFIFLFGAATYWVVVAGGNTIKGATSDWSVRDFLGGVLVVPLGGLGLQYLALLSMNRPRVKVGSNIWPALVGLALGLAVVALVLPLLVAADAGGFGEIGRWLGQFDFELELPGFVWAQLVLSLPTSAYIFALVVGNVRRGLARQRATTLPEDEPATGYRFMPGATAVALLGVVSALYLVFILTQLPYFFAAFGGRLPEGWASYAQFARQGFFELCAIAVINLAVILGVHFSVEKGEGLSRALKTLLNLLPLLTLLLIGTAMSKLWLYIDQFGLTMMRVKPAAVLFLLTVIFGSLVLAERAKFSKLRVAVATGVIIMLAFSWLNVEGMVANYNANRYLAGTLPHFDVHVLRDLDVAGVSVAVRLLETTADIGLAAELRNYIHHVRDSDAAIFAEQEEGFEGLGWGLWVETWQRRQARVLARGVRSHVTLEEVVAWVNRQNDPLTRLPLWSLTHGEAVLMVEEVLFPFAVLAEWQGERDEQTRRVWIVDLRDRSITCTASRSRVVQVKRGDLTALLLPAAAEAVVDFYARITDITWADDESTVEFVTGAQQGVGEARWSINADGSDLRLLSVVRPE